MPWKPALSENYLFFYFFIKKGRNQRSKLDNGLHCWIALLDCIVDFDLFDEKKINNFLIIQKGLQSE